MEGEREYETLTSRYLQGTRCVCVFEGGWRGGGGASSRPMPAVPAAPQVSVIGKAEPLSEEKLCPLLAMYKADDFEAAVAMADT